MVSLSSSTSRRPIQPQQMTLLTPKPPQPKQPLFIFFPGMDGSGQLLRRQVDGLENCFDIRCLALPVDDLSNWNSLVVQVAHLIAKEQERTGKRQPVYLCGESFGACLAMKVASYMPSLFERIILINPASSFSQSPWLQWGSLAADWIPNPLYRFSSVGLVPFLIAPDRVQRADQEALLDAMQGVQPKTTAWRLGLLRQFDLAEVDLERLVQPVLLVAGERDRLLPSTQEIQRIAQRLPNAQTRFLPKSGHACLLEWDIQLDDLLRAWMSPLNGQNTTIL